MVGRTEGIMEETEGIEAGRVRISCDFGDSAWYEITVTDAWTHILHT